MSTSKIMPGQILGLISSDNKQEVYLKIYCFLNAWLVQKLQRYKWLMGGICLVLDASGKVSYQQANPFIFKSKKKNLPSVSCSTTQVDTWHRVQTYYLVTVPDCTCQLQSAAKFSFDILGINALNWKVNKSSHRNKSEQMSI